MFFIVLDIVWPLPTLHILILKEIDVTINNCSMKINICWTEGYTYPYVTNLQHLFKINFLSKQNIHFFFYTCKLANHICLVLCLQRKIWSVWKHMLFLNVICNWQLLWIQSYWFLIWYRCTYNLQLQIDRMLITLWYCLKWINHIWKSTLEIKRIKRITTAGIFHAPGKTCFSHTWT